MDVELLKKKAYELGYKHEGAERGCSQCVLAAVKETIGGIDDSVFRAATSFGAGCCGTGHICGALAGGVMAICCYAGRRYEDFADVHKLGECGSIARKLVYKFRDEYGECNCPDVQKKMFGHSFNMIDPVDKERFASAGAYDDKCTSVCGKAAQWVVEILAEEGLLNG